MGRSRIAKRRKAREYVILAECSLSSVERTISRASGDEVIALRQEVTKVFPKTGIHLKFRYTADGEALSNERGLQGGGQA